MSRDPREVLAEAARLFWSRGWMAGTAGNLSLRHDATSFWITGSSLPKGNLGVEDFLRVDLDGKVVEKGTRPGLKPSAETSLHQVVYRRSPAMNAVFHVHTIEVNLWARTAKAGYLTAPPLEMLKGYGIMGEDPVVRMPVFQNHADVPRIARDIDERWGELSVPVALIADHGVTVWAESAQKAHDHLELADYLARYAIAARNAGIDAHQKVATVPSPD